MVSTLQIFEKIQNKHTHAQHETFLEISQHSGKLKSCRQARPFLLLFCSFWKKNADWFWRLSTIFQSGGLVRSRPPLCRKLGSRKAMTFAFAFISQKVLRNHLVLMLCCFRARTTVILLSHFFSCSRLALAFSCCYLYLFHSCFSASVFPSLLLFCSRILSVVLTLAFLSVLPFNFCIVLWKLSRASVKRRDAIKL